MEAVVPSTLLGVSSMLLIEDVEVIFYVASCLKVVIGVFNCALTDSYAYVRL